MKATASVEMARGVVKPQVVVDSDGTAAGTKVRVSGSQRLLLCDAVEVMIAADGAVSARLTLPAQFHPVPAS